MLIENSNSYLWYSWTLEERVGGTNDIGKMQEERYESINVSKKIYQVEHMISREVFW